MVGAFLCYTGMYAIRKSFLAGQYLTLDLGYGLDGKTVLVISQVMCYMVSKFLGIKIISEMSPRVRVYWLIGLVTFGLAMLGLFAVVPPKLKIVALFLNGLPLGMIFGIVFSYIEGRRNTEILAAALSATFIFSTGLVKTVGVLLIQNLAVEEYTMPFYTGLLFFPVFLLSVWMLVVSGPPSQHDKQARTERVPMNAQKRKQFLRENGLGFLGLVIMYILITILRDFRDNFIVEFWAELGYAQNPELITLTEIPVAIIVLVVVSLGVLIQKNKLAFNYGMWLTLIGSLTVLAATLAFQRSFMSPVAWIIATGIGVYLPYILFHCLLFERLIALLAFKGNVGFLFYTADALGYLFSVFVLILKEVFDYSSSWVDFFTMLNIICSIGLFLLGLLVVRYYRSFGTSDKQVTTASING